jgi:hypothetical protein
MRNKRPSIKSDLIGMHSLMYQEGYALSKLYNNYLTIINRAEYDGVVAMNKHSFRNLLNEWSVEEGSRFERIKCSNVHNNRVETLYKINAPRAGLINTVLVSARKFIEALEAANNKLSF